MVTSSFQSEKNPDPVRRLEPPAEPGITENDRLADLEKVLEVYKALVENLKEVIQARDLEIKYLQNVVEAKERLLENYPDDRAFNSLYVLYLNGNRLLPPGSRRRKMVGRFLSLFVR